MKNIRILAISGSLRKASYNTALVRALSQFPLNNMEVIVFQSLGALPLFNPDLENANIDSVVQFKNEIRLSDGLVIASPEYAHGLSGVLKNALDWLVSGDEFIGMPVALLNASPRATHAQAALREVISTMSGCVIESASISVPLLGSHLEAGDIVNHGEIAAQLTQALYQLGAAVREFP